MKLPALLSDGMVLQRGAEFPLWGWDQAGQQVSVSFASQRATAIADREGRWELRLPPLNAGGPFELVVSGSERKTVCDVFMGEVWLCSGQSNMQMIVKQCVHAKEDIASAELPQVRFFDVAGGVSMQPQPDVDGKWTPCSPDVVAGFSALAFQFGCKLYRELNVPIGLIHASSGDTPAESWMSRQALESDSEFAPILDRWDRSFGERPCTEESLQAFHREWLTALREYGPKEGPWLAAAQKARKEGRPLPPRPSKPGGAGSKQSPTVLYNAMIAPLIPYAIRGVVWYQGETNAIQGRSYQYRKLSRALIRDWRRAWGQGDFPFLYVQLANHVDVQGELPGESWAELREAQLMALAEANTAMAVAIDLGEADQIHPRDKRELGRRLCLAALAKAYGRAVEHSGPICQSMTIEHDAIRLRFEHLDGGLMSKGGGKLRGFTIAGADREFVSAEARIEGETVIVRSAHMSKPVAVRYAWADNPECNLYNKTGLPASPFRTDDWPGITADRR